MAEKSMMEILDEGEVEVENGFSDGIPEEVMKEIQNPRSSSPQTEKTPDKPPPSPDSPGISTRVQQQQREIEELRAQVAMMGQQFAVASGNIDQAVRTMKETMQRGLQTATAQAQQVAQVASGQSTPGQPTLAGPIQPIQPIPVAQGLTQTEEQKQSALQTLFTQLKPVLELFVPMIKSAQDAEVARAQTQVQQSNPYEGIKESLGIVGGLLQAFMGIQTTMYKGLAELAKTGLMTQPMVASPPMLPSRSSSGKSRRVEKAVEEEEEEVQEKKRQIPKGRFHVTGV